MEEIIEKNYIKYTQTDDLESRRLVAYEGNVMREIMELEERLKYLKGEYEGFKNKY